MVVGEMFFEQRMGNFSEKTSLLLIYTKWISGGN
jgi:hypothetical protein